MIITYYNNYSWQSINIPVIPWKKKYNHLNKKFLKLRKTQRIFLLTSDCLVQSASRNIYIVMFGTTTSTTPATARGLQI